MQGDSVRQLLSDLNAEAEDVLAFNHRGATADGTPIALCALAAKASSGAFSSRAVGTDCLAALLPLREAQP